MKPRLIVKQKITAFINRYEIYSAKADGSEGELVAFAEQQLMKFKEHVDFYADKEKKSKIFIMRAEKALDTHSRYFVEDADGNRIGTFKKEFAKSILNSTWNILDDKDQPVIHVSENSMIIAVLRRFLGFVPIVGEFLDILMNFFKYHFVFRVNEKEQGRYIKTKLFRDFYRLEMSDTAYNSQDWRTMAAFAVALDALQSR